MTTQAALNSLIDDPNTLEKPDDLLDGSFSQINDYGDDAKTDDGNRFPIDQEILNIDNSLNLHEAITPQNYADLIHLDNKPFDKPSTLAEQIVPMTPFLVTNFNKLTAGKVKDVSCSNKISTLKRSKSLDFDSSRDFRLSRLLNSEPYNKPEYVVNESIKQKVLFQLENTEYKEDLPSSSSSNEVDCAIPLKFNNQILKSEKLDMELKESTPWKPFTVLFFGDLTDKSKLDTFSSKFKDLTRVGYRLDLIDCTKIGYNDLLTQLQNPLITLKPQLSIHIINKQTYSNCNVQLLQQIKSRLQFLTVVEEDEGYKFCFGLSELILKNGLDYLSLNDRQHMSKVTSLDYFYASSPRIPLVCSLNQLFDLTSYQLVFHLLALKLKERDDFVIVEQQPETKFKRLATIFKVGGLLVAGWSLKSGYSNYLNKPEDMHLSDSSNY